jgi:4-amino-4-deoxy-L-arabinose transferase-like glycosyltransferase
MGWVDNWDLSRGRAWKWALAASLVVLFMWGGYAPFFNPDEGRYTSASLEMAGQMDGRPADWVVPHLNGAARLNKPPLIYWCSALCFKLLGASEQAGRLPSMLAGAGVAWLLLVWGRAAAGERTGRLAALVWLSALFPFLFARIANTDMLLAASIALAAYGVWRATDGGRDTSTSTPQNTAEASAEAATQSRCATASQTSRDVWLGALCAGIGMGLGLLSKGPVAMVFPLATGLAALVTTRRVRELLSPRLWAALAVALAMAVAMALPWVLAVQARVPDFLQRFLLDENLNRFSGGVQYHRPSPWWYYLPYTLLGMLPWSAFLLCASRPREEKTRRAAWFWALWAAFVIGAFSLSSTKLPSYVLPAFAPLSLLIALFFSQRMEREAGKAQAGRQSYDEWWAGHWMWAGGLTLVLLLALVGAGAKYLGDEKVVPRDLGLTLWAAVALSLAAPLLGILVFLRRGQVGGLFASVWAAACLLHVVLLAGATRVVPYEDSASLIQAIRPHLRPDDRVVLYKEFQPSAIFYAGRPVYLVDFKNNSGLDEGDIKRSPFFVETSAGNTLLPGWKADGRRTFVLCRWNSTVLPELKRTWNLIGRSNQHRLFSNQPAPPGFSYEMVAPAKKAR